MAIAVCQSPAGHAGDAGRPAQLAQSVVSEPPPPGKSPEYDAAFKAMQEDPGDSTKALHFAEIAAQQGDYEGAIGALERVLIFNPDLATVRAQLGILYYRLGAQARAQEYLSRALEKDLEGPLASQARETLTLSQKALSDNQFSGSLQLGFRGQTNVNAGPNNGIARIVGFDTQLPRSLRSQGDGNFTGTATLSHVYNPHWVDGTTWESNAFAYGAKQFNIEVLDTFYGAIDTGPRFFVPAISETFSLRPYARLDDVIIGGINYFTGYGGGLSFNAPITDKFSLNGAFEGEHFEYYTDTLRPRVNDKTGPVLSLSLTPFYALTDSQAIALIFRGSRILANAGYETAWRFAVAPNYYVLFDPGWTGQPWQANAYFAHVSTNYSQPDILVDPFNTRRDREWDIGAGLTIGLMKNLSAQLTVQQAWIDSSIPNYRFDNFSGQVVVVWNF
jgi:hypothetical protein